jgi:6-pyruvoyl-tetrahydropterin synthase
MYSLTIRDHMMIAHSLPGEAFGPAQNLHGATYVVDVTFWRPQLDSNDIVIDIGLASDVVKATLGKLNYRNLDEVEDFRNRRSTTEALAKWVFDRMVANIADGSLGEEASGVTRIRVVLNESHVASAAYESDL